jgi:hypothetical protein
VSEEQATILITAFQCSRKVAAAALTRASGNSQVATGLLIDRTVTESHADGILRSGGGGGTRGKMGGGAGQPSGQNRSALARRLQGEYQWLLEDVLQQIVDANNSDEAAAKKVLDMISQ